MARGVEPLAGNLLLPEILTQSTSAENFSLLNILEIYLAIAQWSEWAVYLVSLVSEYKCVQSLKSWTSAKK